MHVVSNSIEIATIQGTPLSSAVALPPTQDRAPVRGLVSPGAKCTSPTAPPDAPRLVSLDVVPHVRRKNARFAAIFEARLRDQEQIKQFFTCDISLGGTFLRSENLFTVGSPVELVLVHPRTHSEFELAATVVRVSEGGARTVRGMGVKFADMSEHTRSEFEQFVMSGVKGNAYEHIREVMRLRGGEGVVD